MQKGKWYHCPLRKNIMRVYHTKAGKWENLIGGFGIRDHTIFSCVPLRSIFAASAAHTKNGMIPHKGAGHRQRESETGPLGRGQMSGEEVFLSAECKQCRAPVVLEHTQLFLLVSADVSPKVWIGEGLYRAPLRDKKMSRE